MSNENPQLSQYWCTKHWEPYADPKDAANGAYANVAVPQVLWTLPQWRWEVDRAMRDFKMSKSNAATLIMSKWVMLQGKPMCCILGDKVMNKVLRWARKAHVAPAPSATA